MKKLLSIIILALLTGCYYDSKEGLYPSECDTSNVTYSHDIQPLLKLNCYLCHDNAAVAAGEGGGIKLQDHKDVQVVALNGKLYRAISSASGYSMPKGKTRLSDCSISKTDVWIINGALDN